MRSRTCAPIFAAAAAGSLACSGSCNGSGDGTAAHPAQDASPTRQVAFTDIRAKAGLGELGGLCLVFEDLSGDGHPDILAESYDNGGTHALRLYVNLGGGSFRAQPFPYQLTSPLSGGCAAADFDGDGLVDVAVGAMGARRIDLFRNTGGATFQQAATMSAPDAGTPLSFEAIAAADFDGDGRVDLYGAPFAPAPDNATMTCATNPDGFSCTVPARRCAPPGSLFLNAGGFTFGPPRSIDDPSVCGPADANAVAVTDWDGDGRPDLFIANDWGIDSLYVQGPAPLVFHDVWAGMGVKPYNHGMGAAFADFDRDGNLDAYVADLGSDQLYLGSGGGSVRKMAQPWGVATATEFHSGWASVADDFDDDGLLDVWVANSALVHDYDELTSVGLSRPLDPRPQSDFLLRGVDGTRFELFQQMQTYDAQPFVIQGAAAIADFDEDGRVDIVESIGYPQRLELLHNLSDVGHWVDVRLVGHASNRDGLGARVSLLQSGLSPQTRLVQRSRGSVGSSWAVAHFGLGTRADVASITVAWPSGKTQTVTPPIDVDGVTRIEEPQ